MPNLLKSLLVSFMLITPSLVSANIGGYASLTNFSYEVTGPGVSVVPDSFLLRSSALISGLPVTHITSTDIAPDLSFNFFHDFSNSGNTATGTFNFAPGDPSSINASNLDLIDTNYSAITTVAEIRLNYLANTTFTFSADAYANTFTDFNQLASAQGTIDLFGESISDRESASVAVIGFEPATDFDRISISFSSPVDQIITLSVYTLVMANTATLPVPEPETYAMMLAGLGMIGFVSRRKMKKHG